MSEFVIITDGASDLSRTYMQAHRMSVVPLYYSFASQIPSSYPTAGEFSAREFYNALRAGSVVKTAAPGIDDFQRVMRPYLEAGKDIIYVGFSAKLSGTFNVGRLAALELAEAYPQRRIYCLDGKGGSLGQAMLVNELENMRARGDEWENVISQANALAGRICHTFLVPDLQHLRRGGRISGGTAAIGTMLQIMPMLRADEEGALKIVGKTRGKRMALRKLADYAGERMAPDTIAAVSHADAPEDAMFVRDVLRRKYGARRVVVREIGPVLGSHCGPGAVAAFCISREQAGGVSL